MGDMEYCSNCKRDVVASNFASHSAFCERKIQLCQMCNEPVCRTEMEEHVKEYHIMDNCSECGMLMEKWMLEKHKDSCIKRLVTCKFCDISIALDQLDEHSQFCGSRTEQCTICKQYVLLRDQESHPKFCSKLQTCEEYIGDTSESVNVSGINKASCFVKDTVEGDSLKITNRNFSEAYSIPHSRECRVCYANIPWSDMDMHLLECNAASERCFLCGEYVSANEMKDHVMTFCSKSMLEKEDLPTYDNIFTTTDPLSFSRGLKDSFDNETKRCQSCNQYIPLTQFELHNKYCKIDLPVYDDACKDDAGINQQISLENDTNLCLSCNHEIPLARWETHSNYCIMKKKICNFCNEVYSFENEKSHIMSCKKVCEIAEESRSCIKKADKLLNDIKNSDRYEMAKAKSEKCPYCQESVNENYYSDHLEKCFKEHNSGTCESNNFLNSSEPISRKYRNEWKAVGAKKKQTKSKNNSPNKNENKGFITALCQPWQRKGSEKEHATEEVQIPCEFCGVLCSPETIIQHESGCRPDLVSYSHNYMRSDSQSNAASDEYAKHASELYAPFTESAYPDLVENRGCMKRVNLLQQCSDVEPGEFLSSGFKKSSSSYVEKPENIMPCEDLKNKFVKKTMKGTNRDIEAMSRARNIKLDSLVCNEQLTGIESCWNKVSDQSIVNMQRLKPFLSKPDVDDSVELNVKQKPDTKGKILKNELAFGNELGNTENDADLTVLLNHCEAKSNNPCSEINSKESTKIPKDLFYRNSTSQSICKMCKCEVCCCKEKKTYSSDYGNLESEVIRKVGAYPKKLMSNRLIHNQDHENVPEQRKELLSNVRTSSSTENAHSLRGKELDEASWKEMRKKKSSDRDCI